MWNCEGSLEMNTKLLWENLLKTEKLLEEGMGKKG